MTFLGELFVDIRETCVYINGKQYRYFESVEMAKAFVEGMECMYRKEKND